jgi:hypothetical protein
MVNRKSACGGRKWLTTLVIVVVCRAYCSANHGVLPRGDGKRGRESYVRGRSYASAMHSDVVPRQKAWTYRSTGEGWIR